MRAVLVILGILLTTQLGWSQKTGFPNCEYQRVVAHKLDGNQQNSRATSALTNQTGVSTILTLDQVVRFLEVINDTTSYGNIVAACHYPMMGLVFYDQSAKVCATVSICMGCNNIYTEPRQEFALGYERSGFSTATRKELRRQFADWGYPDYGFQIMFDDAEQYRIHLKNRGLFAEEIERLVQEEFGDASPEDK